MLWLAAKQQAGKAGLVAAPLGVRVRPATPAQAMGSYRAARRQEHRLNCQVIRAARRPSGRLKAEGTEP
jgi:hypothetical protein